MVRGQKSMEYQGKSHEKRVSTSVKVISCLGALALAVPFGFSGCARGVERQIASDVQVETGRTGLKEFKGDFERICVTASVLETKNASNQFNLEAAGLNVPGVWNKQTLDVDTNQQFCIDGAQLDVTEGRGEVTIDMPKDIIEHHIVIDPTSINTGETFGPAWAAYEIAADAIKGAPIIRDTPGLKQIRKGADAFSSNMRAQLLTLTSQAATDKCADTTYTLARPWIKKSVIDSFKKGYDLSAHINNDVADIAWRVTVEGKSIDEVDVLPIDSNLTDSVKAIEAFLAEKGGYEIGSGESGECHVTDEIKKQLDMVGGN